MLKYSNRHRKELAGHEDSLGNYQHFAVTYREYRRLVNRERVKARTTHAAAAKLAINDAIDRDRTDLIDWVY